MNNKIYILAKKFKEKFFGTVAFRIKAHSNVIQEHINKDEKLLYVFCGQRGHSNYEIFSSCIIVLTDKRILVGTKRVLFGYFYTSVSLKWFNDLKIQSGVLWGKIIIDTAKEVLVISNLAKGSLYEIENAISNVVAKYRKNNNKDKEN